MKRNNKQPISFDEEDIDESSIMGNKAKSSVWGGAGLSDYAESTMARSTHGPKLDDDVILLMESDSSNANNHLLANNNEKKKSVLSKSSNTKKSISLTSRFSSMIDSLVSRVSRSASSLLNQHTPNINDILDGTADPQRPPQRQPPQQQQEQEESSSSTVVGGVNGNGVHIINSTIPEASIADNATTTDKDVEEVFALREEVDMLKKRILELESNEKEHESSSFETAHYNTAPHNMESNSASSATANNNDTITDIPAIQSIDKLQPHQISRYSRQLLLNDGFGVAGQKQLLSSSILVVGAGGIGSSVLLYLAAAGIGHITIVDYDSVEMTNLHRQVIHKDENASKRHDQVGMNKAASAKLAMLELNPTMSVTALNSMISSQNALELVNKHDVIVDACDNPQTRYVLNDACILANKTLVSGSAMGTEGQLTVYNYNTPINTTTNVDSSSNEADATTMSSVDEQEKKEIQQQQQQEHRKSACYRCLYPNPVPSEGCKSCSDNGVLGMVPGIIGMFQAVEVIKIITGIGTVMHDRLLMYDSLHCSFLNVKKPPARAKCAVCSSNTNETTRTIKTMEDSARSLECVRGPSVCAVSSTSMPRLSADNNNNNISCVQYNETVRKANTPHILLDVRVPRQYDMCSLDGSINLPLEELQSKFDVVDELSNNGDLPIYCLCRRGIASAEATRILIDKANENGDTKVEGSSADGNRKVYNIEGGLSAWVQTVDSEFPQY